VIDVSASGSRSSLTEWLTQFETIDADLARSFRAAFNNDLEGMDGTRPHAIGTRKAPNFARIQTVADFLRPTPK
jgi:hypothetical protein